MALTTETRNADTAATGRALARNGAEALIQLWAANGVDYIFLNPGTDTAPIQEAVVALGRDGERVPTIVPCLFENIALAAAHAYFLVTRRPQVVVVHVDVGTQNLGGNLHNTQRGQGGVVILAGRAPYTFDGDVPGGRDRPVQWQQDQLDQTGIVRNYVKWTYELGRTDTLHHLIPRAFQVAASEPAGAVYMTIARDVLMAPMDGVAIRERERARPIITPAGDPEAIEQLARWLADADAPLAIAGSVGRHPDAVAHLTALADLLGMPVADVRGPVNIPGHHPLFVQNVRADLPSSDVVLVLDIDVPWIPKAVRPPEGARIAQIDIDPLKASIPLWGFPVDLPIQADTSKALPQLVTAVERLAGPSERAKWTERRNRIAAEHAERDRKAAEAAQAARDQRPIPLAWMAAAIAETMPADAIFVDETVTSEDVVRRYVRRDEPGTTITSMSPGLGWGLGGALGTKLAAPSQTVFAIVGDGAFVFGSPIAALYAAKQAKAPFLTVICDNGGYNASKNPVLGLFPDGASKQENAFPGVRWETPPDYATLARSCHAYGERIEDPAELVPALKRGLEALKRGEAAVLDVALPPI